ncbi:hypothetical protein H257_06579 [Aphanomyces astaci]|uniref:NADH-ubiquinone oxidoreductase 21kDa subunit N-terminal domain-containing protein n=1 Tax=Aphanomyces astaci TaxID=112090 RepID=W4GMW3_APHAT|nr:hypothetical protein H257_06579 [Aphanomyces astaci]ETV80233.1 hypothetical protein H257_06579 [Aphanomyces astaci]KAF0775142.1 hypothetical protein AaE_001154 [Aphanomyces astaci]|eukprot:XP_009830157.1 hypothetical protein H257_06579 [Aphanomyces astaci]
MSAPPLDPRLPKFPVKMKYPSFNDTTSNFNFSDYATVAVFSVVSFGAGYVLGRPVRVPSSVATGVLGTVGGYLYSFQNSAARLQGFKE